MTLLLKLTTSLVLLPIAVLASGCSTFSIPDVNTYVTLPYSGDGHGVSTLTHKEIRIPKAQWDEKKKRGIILFSEDWAQLRTTILQNCLMNQCKQSVGALDELFFTIDNALKKIPAIKK